jgi:hypothetical protein
MKKSTFLFEFGMDFFFEIRIINSESKINYYSDAMNLSLYFGRLEKEERVAQPADNILVICYELFFLDDIGLVWEKS